MSQRKIDELFHRLPNVFGIADDILITGFDDMCREHNAMLNMVQRICRKANLKLKKDKCLLRCISTPFLGEVILQSGMSQDPIKVQVLMAMPLPRQKRNCSHS